MEAQSRCEWAAGDPLYESYHDEEWGVPVHDDRKWFEFLVLEGAQAGLSWLSILRRRDGYRAAFDGFDPAIVAGYGPDKIEALVQDARIIRNRRKIMSAVNNAQAFLRVQEEFGSFDAYMWSFVDGQPIVNQWQSVAELPAETELSRQMSNDLKRRGFSFVGPTICYAHMQAAGLVNDHVVTCYRHGELARANGGT